MRFNDACAIYKKCNKIIDSVQTFPQARVAGKYIENAFRGLQPLLCRDLLCSLSKKCGEIAKNKRQFAHGHLGLSCYLETK